MNLSQPIESSHLTLRTLQTGDDMVSYVRWLVDPDINRFLESRFQNHSEESLRGYINTMNASSDTLLLGIFLNNDSRHIGNIKLGPVNADHHHAAIGILLGERDCWGKGYATEAIALLSDYAFEILGLHKLIAGYYESNAASGGAFSKVGFIEEGHLKQHCRSDGGWQDSVMMALINDQEAT